MTYNTYVFILIEEGGDIMSKANPKCPQCETNEYVRFVKTFSKVGGADGIAAAGAMIGSVVPFVGTVAGGFFGGILGFLGGALTGHKLGKKIGKQVDETRGLYRCEKCGKEFESD